MRVFLPGAQRSAVMMTSLAVREEAIQAHLDSLEEKEFPTVRNANANDFIDNSLVAKVSRSGFLP